MTNPDSGLKQGPIYFTSHSDLRDFNAQCKALGKSRAFVYKAIRELGLPAIRMGNRWMFSKAQTDAWLASLPGMNLPDKQ